MKLASLEALRVQPGDAVAAPSSSKGRAVNARQKAALDAALAGRLQLYPRGYAASKLGPFHSRKVVLSLVRAGLMKVSTTMHFASATSRARDIHSNPTDSNPTTGQSA